jgi:hypothetical protein
MEAAPFQPRRVESPARWQAALWRAVDTNVKVFQVAGSGVWIATSASRPGVCYEVTTTECQCEAAVLGKDSCCVHRAALRLELGILWPEAAAA